VWLDRGELDKIIDRSLSPPAPQPPQPQHQPQQHQQPQYPQQQYGQPQYHKRKKRESWLSELFD
jgi:Zn-finger nucleic acid-binding protein